MADSITDTSKFLSYVLRHEPMAIGLMLDDQGWANLDELIARARSSGKAISRADILAVIDAPGKKRFALSPDGASIRASQGHSVQSVDIAYEAGVPPEFLLHGTADRFLDSILQDGLRAGQRQYVHLTDKEEIAVETGKRHGRPVVLSVAASRMVDNGFKFYQAENGVWLTHSVPNRYIEVR